MVFVVDKILYQFFDNSLKVFQLISEHVFDMYFSPKLLPCSGYTMFEEEKTD